MSDVILNKSETIMRYIKRVHEEYNADYRNLENFTKQDAIILNIQRMCEATIDMAMHVVAINHYGIPQNSRDAFQILMDQGILEQKLAHNMMNMVGFRNIAIHDYQAVNIDIVENIIKKHLDDVLVYRKIMIELYVK